VQVVKSRLSAVCWRPFLICACCVLVVTDFVSETVAMPINQKEWFFWTTRKNNVYAWSFDINCRWVCQWTGLAMLLLGHNHFCLSHMSFSLLKHWYNIWRFFVFAMTFSVWWAPTSKRWNILGCCSFLICVLSLFCTWIFCLMSIEPRNKNFLFLPWCYIVEISKVLCLNKAVE